MKNTKIDNDAERLLQGTLRELEEARLALATAAIAARADRSMARQSLEKAQDLGAELFRVRDQLKGARLDADEGYGRVLDLEMEVRQEQARLAELQVQNQRLGEHLRQALAVHQHDGARWQAELARVVKVHEQDTAVWQAEVERVQLVHQHDKAGWQAELDRVQLVHQNDTAGWQAELDRVQLVHQHDKTRWQAELDRVQLLHLDDKARWQAELDRVNARAQETARTLGEVLSSRSWRMTRGLRQVIERMHGRRWEEPAVPAAGAGTPGTLTRGIPDTHGDD